MDHYEVLGIDKNASEADIKKAFKRQASRHHPDTGGDEEKFKNVVRARDILTDSENRKHYDEFGTEKEKDNPLAKVHLFIISAFMASLDKRDPIASARNIIQQNITKVYDAIGNIKKERKKFKKAQKKLHYTGTDMNLLHNHLQSAIEGLEHKIELAEEELEKLQIAHTLCNDWYFEEAPEQFFISDCSATTSTTGTF